MTIGIYALYWQEQDLIYIGQSVEIETRLVRHLWELSKQTHTNYKVQNAYNLYGKPEMFILEKCLSSNLNKLEKYWTEDFDSINKGLNLIEAGGASSGTLAANSKYSRSKILRVFSYLYRSLLTIKEVSALTKVKHNVVSDILAGRSHYWLKEQYPEQYITMMASKTRREEKRRAKAGERDIRGSLVDPEGKVYNDISNIAKFVRDNRSLFPKCKSDTNVVIGLGRVFLKTRDSYLGWKLQEVEKSELEDAK